MKTLFVLSTCTIALLCQIAVAQINNGGGGGGVTNSAGNNVVTKSNGTNLVASSITDNATTVSTTEPVTSTGSQPQLTAGANGGTAGQLGLAGSTSGTATLTAPAVAGTSTNQIAVTNVMGGPEGTAPAPTWSFSAHPQTGMYDCFANQICFSNNNAGNFRFLNAQLVTGSSTTIGWSGTSGDATQAIDTALSRTAAAVVAFGNGSAADETALIREANACRITSDVTLSTSATNICSFSLPAVAKAWYWHCDILWSVTAGTTPTIAFGVNASQTPTTTTNGFAEIKTTAANAATEGTAAISASGAVNLLTSPTLTTAATIWSATSFGTLAASATAGTFAITSTGTGASFAGVVRAGTGCYLH